MTKQLMMMRRVTVVTALAWFAITLLVPVTVSGQAVEAKISGMVTDQTGAAIPGAKVTLKNLSINLQYEATTSSEGLYVMPPAPAGTYSVTFAAQGFQTVSQTGIILNVGDRKAINQELNVAARAETVTVEAAGPMVETVDTQLGKLVDNRLVVSIPLPTRNIYDLVFILPGVVPGGTGNPSAFDRGPAVNGQRGSGSNYILDGADNNNQGVSGVNTGVPLDAVQEFKIITSSFNPEYGRNTGFVANVITKSGTNAFHGTVWEFHRNKALNANSYFNNLSGVGRPPFVRNQFGFETGGPIKKDRSFIYGSLEWIKQRRWLSQARVHPTADFVQQLQTARPSSLAASLLKQFPPLSMNGEGALVPGTLIDSGSFVGGVFTTTKDGISDRGLYNYNPKERFDNANWLVKWDHLLDANGKHRLGVRWTLDDGDVTANMTTSSAGGGYPGFGTPNNNRGQNGVLNLTSQLGPATVNEFRVGFNRNNSFFGRPFPDIPQLTTQDGTVLPGKASNLPQDFTENTFQWVDSLALVRGKHTLKTGFEYRRTRNGSNFNAFENGTFRFSDLRRFANDTANRFEVSMDPRATTAGNLVRPDYYRGFRANEYYIYFQDEWKALRRLTLHWGLRYEYFGVPHNFRENLDSNVYFGSGSTYEERVAGMRFMLTKDGPLKGLVWGKDKNNWAPRFGFAWDVTGTGRTAIRANFGVFYDRMVNNIFENIRFNLPAFANVQIFAAPGPTTYSYTIPVGAPASIRSPIVSPRHMNENLLTAYAENAYLSVEHEFANNYKFQAAYVGTFGHKLNITEAINRTRAIPGVGFMPTTVTTCDPGGLGAVPLSSVTTSASQKSRANPCIGGDNFRTSMANSNYHAFQLTLEKRFSKGFQFNTNYVWSRTIDDVSDSFAGYNGVGYASEFNRKYDRGLAEFHLKHRFNLTGVWELPAFRAQQGAVGKVLGGWHVSGRFAAREGFPFSPLQEFDTNEDRQFMDRADFAPGFNAQNVYVRGKRPNDGYVDPLAFTYPVDILDSPTATGLGNAGRNILIGPGNAFVNLAFYKRTKITERIGTEFRFEMFNAFNHTNFFAPSGDIDESDGFQSTDTFDPRIIQFGLKITW